MPCAVTETVAPLRLLALTDAFSGIWAALAEECALTLERASAGGIGAPGEGVVVVAAGGDEGVLEGVLREVAGTSLPVAAVGTVADHRLATALIRAGATEYFVLPEDYDLLRSWLRERAERIRTAQRRSDFTNDQARKYRFEGILGQSQALSVALEQAARLIPHPNVTVLIAGETGTGKELLARALHYNGPRARAPFVDVNCAAIPENLLESELFGHEKGAFTGATTTKPGLFEAASGGTLFLDEIGHLPLTLQGKLLRALEERQIRRVGGMHSFAVDVRIVAATHVNLEMAARRGEFREDLYYRLSVVPIALPPLRARRDDILPLVRHFVHRFATDYGVPAPALTARAERALVSRAWPGNIRELRNVVERAVLLAPGPTLDESDFQAEPQPEAADRGGLPFPAPLGTLIRAAVLAMVDLCDGNKSEAARRLEISRTRLLRNVEAGGTGVDDDEPGA